MINNNPKSKSQLQKKKSNLKTKENIKRKSTSTNSQQVKKRIQADDKSARIKKAQQRRKLFSWTILIGIFVGILVFLLKSETFQICNIEITGNNQISREELLLLSGIDLEDNIFISNTIKAENKISKNPYIKEVKIKRILPDKIKIEVTEKEKKYMIQIEQQYACIDVNGDILEISDAKLDNLIILQGYSTTKEEIIPGNKLAEDDLERLEDIHIILKSCEKIEINNQIASINIKDKNDYTLNLPTHKKIVYIGDTSNLSTKMLYTKDILNKTIDKEGKIFVNGKFNDGFDPYFREEVNN